MSILNELKKCLKEDEDNSEERYTPEFIYDYVSDMHMDGWEEKEFEDKEWIMSHDYFILTDVSLDDDSVKWNWGYHPPIVNKYAQMSTDIPPIVIASDGYIIDGTHRSGATKKRGESTISAYVGIK